MALGLVTARDLLDRQCKDFGSNAFTELSVFRFLLFHTWYQGPRYGYVSDNWNTYKKLAEGMCCSERTIMRAFKSLVDGGLIERRTPNQIYIKWLETNSQ
jgi:hypothetical protein